MRCPVHPGIWLYENMTETRGFCPECSEWYWLKNGKKVEQDEK